MAKVTMTLTPLTRTLEHSHSVPLTKYKRYQIMALTPSMCGNLCVTPVARGKCLQTSKTSKIKSHTYSSSLKRLDTKCWFLPKCHCELNPCTRDGPKLVMMSHQLFLIGFRNAADGTFLAAKRLVPELLNACSVCAFFRKVDGTWMLTEKDLMQVKSNSLLRNTSRFGPKFMVSLDILVD
ncbi:hypothetical protein K503DRAFT_53556 [Rhizopogon vinicolor AM-OR11-026]|uniref:Uncharacterized protein n=1 Tax=Rhizopogon vinicolor AM-OR11-026 TaxID=1314800 RepID=A0A1B7N4M0_9AGAM|nr:hypothetical protein K503DRAFT_53556 [Rhizopogon vinicolor AM-OR11-026]